MEKIIRRTFTGLVLVLIMVLMIVGHHDKNDVSKYKRYATQVYFTEKSVADENSPLKKKRVYTKYFNTIGTFDDTLAFYCMDSDVHVYVDNKLIYSLTANQNNIYAKSTGINWILVPMTDKNDGKKLRIEIEPIYDDNFNDKIKFYQGSELAIYREELSSNVFQLSIAGFLIVIGFFFILTDIYTFHKSRTFNPLIYLGIFAILLGDWKVVNNQFIPLLFYNNTNVLSFISYTTLLLGPIPLMQYIRYLCRNKYAKYLNFGCLFSLFINMLSFILMNYAHLDLKETLGLSHLSLTISVILIMFVIIYEYRSNMNNNYVRIEVCGFFVCLVGVCVDLYLYYRNVATSGQVYTIIAFTIYLIILSFINNSRLLKEATTDLATSLNNKSRCIEVLNESEKSVVGDKIGCIMIDLNGLKSVNDEFGHEAGDKLIHDFASYIKEVVKEHEFAGRFGGDEFIIIAKGTHKLRLEKIIEDLQVKAETFTTKEAFPMSFSSGYAFSEDYDSVDLRTLMKFADHYMYEEKKAYHRR